MGGTDAHKEGRDDEGEGVAQEEERTSEKRLLKKMGRMGMVKCCSRREQVLLRKRRGVWGNGYTRSGEG